MIKQKIHPHWFKKAIVFYNGKPLCFIGSTKEKLFVETWLINHKFYLKSEVRNITEGPAENFMKKYNII